MVSDTHTLIRVRVADWLRERRFYIRGILRNRMAYMSEWKAMSILRDALKAGVSVEDMEHAAKQAVSWSEWQNWIDTLVTEADQ